MSSLCECNLKISKTVISKQDDGLYCVQYGVGWLMDYKVKFVTANRHEILYAGAPFCPHNLPKTYSFCGEFFSV